MSSSFYIEVPERPIYIPGSGPPLRPITLAPDNRETGWVLVDLVDLSDVPTYIVTPKDDPVLRKAVKLDRILDWVSPKAYEDFEYARYKKEVQLEEEREARKLARSAALKEKNAKKLAAASARAHLLGRQHRRLQSRNNGYNSSTGAESDFTSRRSSVARAIPRKRKFSDPEGNVHIKRQAMGGPATRLLQPLEGQSEEETYQDENGSEIEELPPPSRANIKELMQSFTPILPPMRKIPSSSSDSKPNRLLAPRGPHGNNIARTSPLNLVSQLSEIGLSNHKIGDTSSPRSTTPNGLLQKPMHAPHKNYPPVLPHQTNVMKQFARSISVPINTHAGLPIVTSSNIMKKISRIISEPLETAASSRRSSVSSTSQPRSASATLRSRESSTSGQIGTPASIGGGEMTPRDSNISKETNNQGYWIPSSFAKSKGLDMNLFIPGTAEATPPINPPEAKYNSTPRSASKPRQYSKPKQVPEDQFDDETKEETSKPRHNSKPKQVPEDQFDYEIEGETSEEDIGDVWEINGILSSSRRPHPSTGKMVEQYLIDWAGDYEPSWEPGENVSDDAIKIFEAGQDLKKRVGAKVKGSEMGRNRFGSDGVMEDSEEDNEKNIDMLDKGNRANGKGQPAPDSQKREAWYKPSRDHPTRNTSEETQSDDFSEALNSAIADKEALEEAEVEAQLLADEVQLVSTEKPAALEDDNSFFISPRPRMPRSPDAARLKKVASLVPRYSSPEWDSQ